MNTMVRRTIGFILTVITMIWSTQQVIWNPDLKERIVDNPFQSFGFLVAVLATVALWLWLVFDTNTPRAIGACVLSVIVALWGNDLLDGIAWGQIGMIFGSLVVIVILWYITVWNVITFRGRNF